MASVKGKASPDNSPGLNLGVTVQQATIGSRYAVPKPVNDGMTFSFPPIPSTVRKRGLPKRPPNAVSIYTWRHKIDTDTRPFGPLMFERMPSRYERKTKEQADIEIVVFPDKKKNPLMTLSIDSNMQIDEKMIVAKLIQTKLFKTIRTMKRDRAKAAAIRAARKTRAINRAKAAEAATRQFNAIPPIIAQGRNCLVRTLPLGRPRCPSQQGSPTYKWYIATRRK